MDIMEMAKQLGQAIRDSKEMQEYNRCEALIQSDEKSQTLLNDYKTLQIELVKATRGNRPEAEINEIKEMLMAKQAELNEYEYTANYLNSKVNLDRLMKTVNDVIVFGITGEEPSCSPSKCSTCGGGCKQ